MEERFPLARCLEKVERAEHWRWTGRVVEIVGLLIESEALQDQATLSPDGKTLAFVGTSSYQPTSADAGRNDPPLT